MHPFVLLSLTLFAAYLVGGIPFGYLVARWRGVNIFEQGSGLIGCYDAKTGKQHYRQRIPDASSFTSSPWAADGKIYCLDQDGRTSVLQAGPELKVLGANKLNDVFWSSVAVAKGEILLRGVDRLYCIAKR